MKRTNFSFPESMLERLKAAKQQTGIPVSEILRRAVEAYLKSIGL
jgi:predicted DNA-binding protein